jgi:hypothetical protein
MMSETEIPPTQTCLSRPSGTHTPGYSQKIECYEARAHAVLVETITVNRVLVEPRRHRTGLFRPPLLADAWEWRRQPCDPRFWGNTEGRARSRIRRSGRLSETWKLENAFRQCRSRLACLAINEALIRRSPLLFSGTLLFRGNGARELAQHVSKA